jgi:hypothetical protein
MAKAKQLALLPDDEIGDTPDSVSRSAFEIWNECAKKFGWVTTREATLPLRAVALRKVVKVVGGILGWRKLLEAHGASDFICGKTYTPGRKAFSFTLDWAVKPANLTKLLDGNYLEEGARVALVQGKPAAAAEPGPKVEQDPWRRWLSYRKGGFWPSHLGPRPDEPGCRMTPALLMNWRRENGIEVTVPKGETEEERLTTSIASLRKYGKWDRANAAEERLAAIQKRPPVLVPAPDVAHLGMAPRDDLPPQRTPDMRGHNRPPGPITDVPDDGDPGWTDIPEGDPAMAEP